MKPHRSLFRSSISLAVLHALLSFHASPLTAASTQALVAEALQKNPEIHFYEAEIQAARAGRLTASQLANPDLNLEAGGIRIKNQGGGSADDGPVWRASISQVIDFPGRMALRKAIADRDIALAELGLLQFRSQLTNQVRALSGDVALLKRRETALRTVRERLAALIEVLVQRDSGAVNARLERRILEASLLSSDRALTDAEKERRESAATLSVLCGRQPDTELLVDDHLPAFPAAPSLEALKQRAAETNFDLQQKRLNLARQGLKVDLAKSERWGNISFGPYLGGQSAGDREVEGGIGFSIPLPLWNRNKGGIQAEQARMLQAEALMAATLRDLERDLTISRAAYAAELKSLSNWKIESESEFAKAAADADEHFRLGAVPASTYVEMQRGYTEAIDSLILSRRNAWTHLMELERLIGTTIGKEGRP